MTRKVEMKKIYCVIYGKTSYIFKKIDKVFSTNCCKCKNEVKNLSKEEEEILKILGLIENI